MPHFLLEIGCEELPASSIVRANRALAAEIQGMLEERGLGVDGVQLYGTPRRLIVAFDGLLAQQPDREKRSRGPAVGAAYDAEGKPTKALEGFCRGQGVDPATAESDGQYVWVTKTEPGRPTQEILGELIPLALEKVPFSKTMRWADLSVRFARPVRWILAAFDGELVPCAWAGIASGLASRGHRFEHPGPFEARTLDDLVRELRARMVEPDPQVRMQVIADRAQAVCSGTPDLSGDLVEENAFLTEWPEALEGSFPDEYLELPEPVLVTTMAKHERFFPVRDEAGRLMPKFISIRGGGVDEDVRKGNEWVLRARFNDARFFFIQDQRRTLDEFLEATQGMNFDAKLGTIRQRADRLASLARTFAEVAYGADVAGVAELAGRYAKADLTTGLVDEMDELQGVIGGVYAQRDGLSADVAHAIGTHYAYQSNLMVVCVGAKAGLAVTLADQMDKLAGFLGLGRIPSGSSDPLGLRRAANILIEIAENGGAPTGYESHLDAALAAYAAQGVELDREGAHKALKSLMEQRYRSRADDIPADWLDAAMGDGQDLLNPLVIQFRVLLARELAGEAELLSTLSRPLNLWSAAQKQGLNGSEGTADLQSAEGEQLRQQATQAAAGLNEAYERRDAMAVKAAFVALSTPIHQFFESTMVMAEDTQVRDARLALVRQLTEMIRPAGDITKIIAG
ncbi:MAG: glycine--tRNA ligase subunit beta [Armatimonadota bacterium]|nr:glycine--tRNA ligase subunit beta [Fimbriimonadaceae bacterium]